ncbi:hypothetical protein EPN15_02335 [Patescibacteria group bacterium]|nr:MAG: hypothetical protein EPN15_02335 [Patescibacteria group bacterium]
MKSSKIQVSRYKTKGFTFVEIAMVVGILALVSSIVIVNLNIRGNKSAANNIKRRTDLENIQKALDLRAHETGDSLPANFSALTATYICVGTSASCYNLTPDLVPNYLGSIPKDPKSGTDANTGYLISVDPATKVVCVKAPAAENDEVIENCRK